MTEKETQNELEEKINVLEDEIAELKLKLAMYEGDDNYSGPVYIKDGMVIHPRVTKTSKGDNKEIHIHYHYHYDNGYTWRTHPSWTVTAYAGGRLT